MSNFVRAWYPNTEENQEALFKLGYQWEYGGFMVRELRYTFLYTNADGYLTWAHTLKQGTPKGKQLPLKNPRPYAELIKQWADDDSLVIEVKHKANIGDEWISISVPTWDSNRYTYRIKPDGKEQEIQRIEQEMRRLSDDLANLRNS